MKTIFVTGGAGFIGSAFIRQVLDETSDVEIIDFDALTYAGNLDNLKGLDESRHTFVHGDITDTFHFQQSSDPEIMDGTHGMGHFSVNMSDATLVEESGNTVGASAPSIVTPSQMWSL